MQGVWILDLLGENMTTKRYYLGNGELYTICDSSKGGSDMYNMLTKFEVVDLLNALHEENQSKDKIIKGQELEIIRLHGLADAMSGALRELGVYDVYNKEQIQSVKERLK